MKNKQIYSKIYGKLQIQYNLISLQQMRVSKYRDYIEYF